MEKSIPYYRALMSEGAPSQALPKLVEPRKFAHQSCKLAGIVPEDSLPRLANISRRALPSEAPRNASAALQFEVDEQGRRCISGQLSAKVVVDCQRCLEPLELAIETSVSLAVVRDEDAAGQLPGHLEPWIVPEEQGDLYAILEEELLLAMPAVAYHQHQCVEPGLMSAGDDDMPGTGREAKENPFSILAQLKQDKQTD